MEVDTGGDAFFVAFARAADAVQAAATAQRALAEHDWPADAEVRVRMGLHTGAPEVREDHYWGTDVHYAARLAAAAHGRQVLVSAATRQLIDAPLQDLGEHRLKDFPEPRRLFHLVLDGATADRFPPPRTLEVVRTNLPPAPDRLIGREGDLEALAALCKAGGSRLSGLSVLQRPSRRLPFSLLGAGGSWYSISLASRGSSSELSQSGRPSRF